MSRANEEKKCAVIGCIQINRMLCGIVYHYDKPRTESLGDVDCQECLEIIKWAKGLK